MTTDINDEKYWSNLESISKNSSATTMERDRRRQNLRDAIDGIDILRHTSNNNDGNRNDNGNGSVSACSSNENGNGNSSDSNNNTNGNKNDEREERMASLGLVTGKSSLVGTRSLFGLNHPTTTATSDQDQDPEDPTNYTLYPNLEQCIDELQQYIIETFDKKVAPRKYNPFIRSKWIHIRQQIIEPLKLALKADLLPQILERRTFWCNTKGETGKGKGAGGKGTGKGTGGESLMKRVTRGSRSISTSSSPRSNTNTNDSSMVIIPYEFIEWLIRTSLSGKTVGTELCIGAHTMIIKVLQLRVQSSNNNNNNLTILKLNEDNEGVDGDDDFEGSTTMKNIFQIKDFISILESEFGLWTKEGPPPTHTLLSSHSPSSSQDDTHQNNKRSTSASASTSSNMKKRLFDNEFGLRHAFELWSAAFVNDFVSYDGIDECPAIVARFVAIVCRSGVDPSFHTGNRLLQAQGQLLNSIFDWMKQRFQTAGCDGDDEENDNGDSDRTKNNHQFHRWIEHSAEMTVEMCSSMPTTIIPKGEIMPDRKGYLPLSLAVRTCQTIDQTKEELIMFFASFSRRAAQLCMEDIVSDWDSKVEKNSKALIDDIKTNDSSSSPSPTPSLSPSSSPSSSMSINLKIECVATTEIILEFINKVGEKVTRDGPRFLATVDIALHCEQMGIALFNINAQNMKDSVPVGIYESKAEAEAMGDHFERLEHICNILKKRVMSVLVDKNMMRVKELLSLMYGFYRDCKSKAYLLSNRRESTTASKQSHMDSFFKVLSPDESF